MVKARKQHLNETTVSKTIEDALSTIQMIRDAVGRVLDDKRLKEATRSRLELIDRELEHLTGLLDIQKCYEPASATRVAKLLGVALGTLVGLSTVAVNVKSLVEPVARATTQIEKQCTTLEAISTTRPQEQSVMATAEGVSATAGTATAHGDAFEATVDTQHKPGPTQVVTAQAAALHLEPVPGKVTVGPPPIVGSADITLDDATSEGYGTVGGAQEPVDGIATPDGLALTATIDPPIVTSPTHRI